MATTGNRYNDTPVQPQSERDKTVVGNGGGGCERTSQGCHATPQSFTTLRGTPTPVELTAASRLMSFCRRTTNFTSV